MKQSCKAALLLLPTLVGGQISPAAMAEGSRASVLEEVMVTARRREESLQEVPVSMTVFDQKQLGNANIVNAGDLAAYTPSLHSNNRFGSDNTTFAIRGFSQELRTTSSVGVYFADVIAPRGANATQSGDGAGPGDFFDLENVQVLKGPQGTLFGRNTTGGAVLLSPKKPTDTLEGYSEVSVGNYGMKRGQAVLNLPVSERFRMRLGVDSQKREGHLENKSGIGPDDFSDVDYMAYRISAVLDITDNLENYTVLKSVSSDNNNTVGLLFECNPSGNFGGLCAADQARRAASGADGFYDVWSSLENPGNELDQWQAINTTTWEVSDALTVKNIVSYAEIENSYQNMIYGTNWQFPILSGGSQELIFAMAGVADNRKLSTNQSTFVEELQFQGSAFDERMNWQAGLYYEKSKPIDDYGSQSPSLISCDRSTISSGNPADWRCNDLMAAGYRLQFGIPASIPFYVGSVVSAPGGVTYENKAVYVQSSYELTDQWTVTGGLRYTDDETTGYVRELAAKFPGDMISGGYFAPEQIVVEERRPESSSEKPTWLIGLDYKPTDTMMMYGKYSRGYRQGSVNVAASRGLDVHGPEQVDTYELGLKTQFDGRFPATLNAAVFYNDFQDQQVQFGYLSANGVGTTAIVNAGASTIQGLELDANVQLTDNLVLSASYAYLDTKVDELIFPTLLPGQGSNMGTTTAEGEPLSFSPENKVVLTAAYRLPVDDQWGDMTAAITYVYTDKQQAVSTDTSPFAVLPSYELVNLNFNWEGIAGGPVDASMFVTNLTDEEYRTSLTGNWAQGMELGQVGQPRMYGARVKYNF